MQNTPERQIKNSRIKASSSTTGSYFRFNVSQFYKRFCMRRSKIGLFLPTVQEMPRKHKVLGQLQLLFDTNNLLELICFEGYGRVAKSQAYSMRRVYVNSRII